MPRVRPRRFTLLDGMILIAGLAIGFAPIKLTWRGVETSLDSWSAVQSWIGGSFCLGLYGPTFALFLIRLRQPRPSFRRLIRQPGFAAVVAVLTSTLIYCPADFVSWYESRLNFFEGNVPQFFYWGCAAKEKCAPAIAIVWLSLWITGRWRAERSWIDRSGRVLAVVWLLTIFCHYALGRWVKGEFSDGV